MQLYLKGGRVAAGKSAIERRPYPLGKHGQGRPRPSEYRLPLREKQKAKRYYGVRERQFRLYFQRARRASGPVGENLLRGLERPLDNVLYRLGLAGTRAQARQFVGHRHVLVNGRAGDRPSYEVEPDDVISPEPDAPIEPVGAGRHGAGRRRTRLAPGGSRHLTGRVERSPSATRSTRQYRSN